MEEISTYDVIIIGGSYAGLSAAMTLGRSLRSVLIIDAGTPCNQPADYAHNLIGYDGSSPASIRKKAKAQVLKYHSVTFMNGKAVALSGIENDFQVVTDTGLTVGAKKVLLATGVTDILPDIPGFAECWGKTAVHCPYCHGYEIASKKIGVLAHGDAGFEMVKLIRQWSTKLFVLANDNDDFDDEALDWMHEKKIPVIPARIKSIDHHNGGVSKVEFEDGTNIEVDAIYARTGVTQQMDIPLHMGCEFDSHGFIIVDDNKKTNIPGMFAAGDNTTSTRTLSMAIAAGTVAGIHINKELVDEDYKIKA
ncbi:MAG TPA: NAD(P)/FAD-dependent oxidoreductase [Flavobacterium sp.]